MGESLYLWISIILVDTWKFAVAFKKSQSL